MLTLVNPDDIAVLETRTEGCVWELHSLTDAKTIDRLATRAELRRAALADEEQATADAIIAEGTATVRLVFGTLGDILGVLDVLGPNFGVIRPVRDEQPDRPDGESAYDGLAGSLGMSTLWRLADEVEARLGEIIRGWIVMRAAA